MDANDVNVVVVVVEAIVVDSVDLFFLSSSSSLSPISITKNKPVSSLQLSRFLTVFLIF